MPTIYKDTGYSLTHIIEDIKHGKMALPDIQRPFVWSTAKIRDLFDSMYRGYPVGTLMFWETGAGVGTKQVGGGDSKRAPQLLIVDGQQRLTSLYAVLTGREVLTSSFQKRRIRIAFNPATEQFDVADAAIERDPNFIPDITDLWQGSYRSGIRAFFDHLENATEGDIPNQLRDRLEERIDRVRDLRDFRFQVIELGENANEEQVAEIFVRINSEGVKLSQADFILTLMSVYWEDGRRALEDFARACVDPAVTGNSPKNDFIDPGPDQLLRAGVALAFGRGRLANVYQLLRGKDLDTGEVSPDRRTAQFRELAAAQDNVLDLLHWHEFLKCLKLAGFRNHKMISSFNAIIYTYALWLIGRCHHGIEVTALRPVIARWFFMVQTTGRYTSSPESAIESDLRRLERIAKGAGDAFCEELDRIIRANFTTDYWDITLPSALDTAASRSPALFAYWAALNILDAEALFSNLNIRDLIDSGTNSKKGIERHHLFPQAFLKAKGVTSRAAINAIANMSFVDWPEHAPIGAQDPADYWQEAIAGMSSDRLHQHIKWHALPTGWEQLDFETFKERRRERIAQVVKEGFHSLFEEPGQVNLKVSVAELAQLDESQTLEFKSTARWNVRANQADKKMEHIVLKTVCGFLNAEGGKLLIGIDDDGNAVGLEPDYSTLKKSDRDGYQLWLRQYIESNLSIPTAKLIRIGFGTVGNHDVAVVTIAPSGKPAFAKGPGDQQPNEFWVRIGNQTKQLHGDEMVEYQGQHWS